MESSLHDAAKESRILVQKSVQLSYVMMDTISKMSLVPDQGKEVENVETKNKFSDLTSRLETSQVTSRQILST